MLINVVDYGRIQRKSGTGREDADNFVILTRMFVVYPLCTPFGASSYLSIGGQ